MRVLSLGALLLIPETSGPIKTFQSNVPCLGQERGAARIGLWKKPKDSEASFEVMEGLKKKQKMGLPLYSPRGTIPAENRKKLLSESMPET